MGEAEYVIGLEPGNCHPEGRQKEKEIFKTLQYLKPGEIKKSGIELEMILE